MYAREDSLRDQIALGWIAILVIGSMVFSFTIIQSVLRACEEACRLCAEECDRHASMHEHCRICAESCRRCEQACQAALQTFH